MKRFVLFFLIVTFSFSNSYSQGGVFEKVKEDLEHWAVEWVLQNDTIKNFTLTTLYLEATTLEELKRTSLIPFTVLSKYKKYVLLCVVSKNWVNEYGVDFNVIIPYQIDQNYWSKIMINYLNASTLISKIEELDNLNKIPIYEEILITDNELIEKYRNKMNKLNIIYLNVDNKHLLRYGDIRKGGLYTYSFFEKTNETLSFNNFGDITKNFIIFNKKVDKRIRKVKLPLLLSGGDTHMVREIDDKLMVDFNEKNMNLFLKDIEVLIKLKRNIVVQISHFLNPF